MENKEETKMRIFFICSCVLFCASFAHAYECSEENAKFIEQLETQLNNCKIDIPDNATDIEMINAYDDFTNCLKIVAYQLFDYFYKNKNQSVKNDFNKVIWATHLHYQNLIRNSDLAQKLYTGALYEVQVKTNTSLKIKEIVQEYIQEMKSQCADLSDLPDDINLKI